MVGKAGRFEVTLSDSGALTVAGPAEYLKSDHYKAAIQKIKNGESAVINYAPPGLSLAHLIAVALQTDFAGWVGFQEMMNWGKKGA